MTQIPSGPRVSAPSGFAVADRLQVDSFEATGSIDGASKVTHAADGTPCCRLRPPHLWTPDDVEDYKDGWADGKAGEVPWNLPAEHAYSMGYRDAAEGRMKWHLPHCKDHGDHETGCQS